MAFLVNRGLVVDVQIAVAEQSHGLRQLPQRTAQCESYKIVELHSLIFNMNFGLTELLYVDVCSTFWWLNWMIFVCFIYTLVASGGP